MINFSIVMRGVNANLFEINQAKARIKAAEAAGKTPAEADTKLVATEKQLAFAVAQYTDVMTIEKFAKHIATHGCVYSRADISAILYMAVDCMREQLLEGKKIRLGDLGDFSISLSSKGAESADKFTSQNITAVNVVWECGTEFKNLLADAEFNLVASRRAQEALLKAMKAGETTVDISKPADDPTDPTDPDGGGGASTDPDGGGTGAEVTKYTLSLTASPSAGGTVTGAGEYAAGTQVAIKATAASGYTFKKWSDGNTNAQRTVTMDAAKSLTATFETSAGGSGSDEETDSPF